MSEDDWYYLDVETAFAQGILADEGTAFRPEDNITREEMAVLLVKALGYSGAGGAMGGPVGLPFSDVSLNRATSPWPMISAW